MSRAARIGLGLIVVGFIGSFFVSDYFGAYSSLWYVVTIISLIMLIVGMVVIWVEWGGKKKK